ncbi:MAG: hypothetical protein CBC13_11780 [Planctomycetia bacterium TMED53]|nr:MAG: hypothetical protein CBC13_11780 [Planctomycetia bacterium TMED53]
MDVLLLSQWITTGFMTGLIWFIQIVHYPIYSFVGHNDLSDYQAFHVRRTTMVVFPFMVTELLGGGLLLLREWHGDRGWVALSGLGLLGVIWLSTLIFQIPRHSQIGGTKNPTAETIAIEKSAIRHLVQSNWIRTCAWTARLALLAIWFPPGN